MHEYSRRLEYKIIFGGEPEEVFAKLGVEQAGSCGCEYMGMLNQRLEEFVGQWKEKWALNEPSIEQYCCEPGTSYEELKSFGRPPQEGTVLMSLRFKNKQYLREIIREASDEFGMRLMFLDKRIDG